MATYELVGFNTDARYRDDVRWREYTTSAKRADEFGQIRKIQFSDSGHGIVFEARELPPGARRKPVVHGVTSHVPGELVRIKREMKLPQEVRDLLYWARAVVGRAGAPSDDVLENHPHEVPGDLYDRFYAAVRKLG
jgi:hypothetical protein